MGKSVKIRLTHSEGSFLLRYSGAALPDKLGEESFDLSAQMTCKDQLASLRTTLRKVSPLANPPSARSAAFGEAEAWEPSKPTVVKCEHCEHDFTIKVDGLTLKKSHELREVELEFDEDSIYGVWWALYLSAHSKYASVASTIDYEEKILPLAGKFGWLEALRDKLEISATQDFLPKRNKILDAVAGG